MGSILIAHTITNYFVVRVVLFVVVDDGSDSMFYHILSFVWVCLRSAMPIAVSLGCVCSVWGAVRRLRFPLTNTNQHQALYVALLGLS